MALTPSGQIAFSDINNEINTVITTSTTAKRALGDAYCRNLAGKTSGQQIGMNNFYGKSIGRQAVSKVYSANTFNASFVSSSEADYIPGYSDITITVNAGVYLAGSGGSAGLTISGLNNGDTLRINNLGNILGSGGQGGDNNYPSGLNAGGPAINLNYTTTVDPIINNTYATAYIAGGGGGGGSARSYNFYFSCGGGGGAGGGTGGYTYGGPGGDFGLAGTSGLTITVISGYSYTVPGGGGGRVIPGTGAIATQGGITNVGAVPSYAEMGHGGGAGGGGAGGGEGYLNNNSCYPNGAGGFGGAGGSTSAGSDGYVTGTGPFETAGGGGGGWGCKGGDGYNNPDGVIAVQGSCLIFASNPRLQYTGGSGGNAVSTNGRTVTWVSGDTTRVYGAVG